jgi:hypothetical protein
MRSNRPDATIAAQLEDLFSMLVLIHRDIRDLKRHLSSDKEQIMAEIDDLKVAVASLITEAVTDLETVIGKLGTTPPDNKADIVALTQQANDTIAKLKADMAPLTTPATPATPPGGAPNPQSDT